MLPNISNDHLLHLPLQIPGAVVSCTGKKVLTDLLLTKVLFMIAYPSIFVVGTVGNLLVVWVCIAVIVLIWCVSILLALPYAVHMRIAQVQWPCHFSLCVEDWVDLEDLRSVYGFVLPFAIIGRSYRLIWRFIESRRAQLLRPISEAQMNRKQRLLRMLVRMVLVFGCCWLPFNILNLLRDLRMDGWLKPYFSFLFLLSHLLSMVVPAANPLLYAWMNSAFRESFLRALPLGGRLRKKLEMMEIGTVGTGQICGGTSSEGRGGREEFQTDNSQQQQLISNRNSREFRTPQRISSTISLRYSPNLSNSHN
uniref:G-protein coupled receptors family 1 profile domain-containing protein n=1 Tax=Meloidogyne javanica TaxID=6303 RepID=A0A915M744_MELJA